MYLLGKLTEDLLKQSKFAWLSISIAKPTSLAKHLADGWSVLLFFVAEAALVCFALSALALFFSFSIQAQHQR
jgi:hypothetical protein